MWGYICRMQDEVSITFTPRIGFWWTIIFSFFESLGNVVSDLKKMVKKLVDHCNDCEKYS